MSNDLINGLFQILGSLFLTLNIIQMYKDKSINGIHPLPTLFFSVWGIWNLFYFASLNQWYSVFGGILITIINFIWLSQVFYYSNLYSKLSKLKSI